MLAVSTWHPPSAVSHSVKCRLTSGDSDSLVVAKISRLEVYDLLPTGLGLRCSFETWGTVTSLLATPAKAAERSKLILTTDHPNPYLYVMDYDSKTSQLMVSHSVSLKGRVLRESEFFNGAILHPNGRVLVTCQYSGTIKVIVLGSEPDFIESDFECRIPELSIQSMCFVPSSGSKLILAILSEDYTGRRRVVARELSLEKEELIPEPSKAIAAGFAQDDATLLIPVNGPKKTTGVLSLGGDACHFFGTERAASKRASTGGEAAAVKSLAKTTLPLIGAIAYSVVDDDRFLIGDSLGRLHILGVERFGPGNTISSLVVQDLGQVSPAASISHIDDLFVYIGSLVGDSQTIRLLPEPKLNGDHFEVIETYSNIGPIMDAVLTHLDSPGQAQIVTCSGSSTAGSLRVIRSGAEFKLSTTVEALPNTEKLFPLRFSLTTKHDAYLLASTPFGSKLFELKDSSIDELPVGEFGGFVRTQRTLAACTLSHGCRAIQVTTTGIHIINLVDGSEVSRWPPMGDPDTQITAVAVNPTQVCIALQAGKLLYFSTREGELRLVKQKYPEVIDGLPNEISSLSIEAHPGQKDSNIVAVGYWIQNVVTLYNLPDLTALKVETATVNETHYPRSLLLHLFGDDVYLVVGLGNGNLVTYLLHKTEGMTARRVSSLGSGRGVSLAVSSVEDAGDDRIIFAAGARGLVLWADKKTGRLRQSAVGIKDVNAVCALDHKLYPGSILFAGNDLMTIGKMGELHKLNIRSIPFGVDNPRQIAHLPTQHSFAVGFSRTEVDPASENTTAASSIRFLDDETFEELSRVHCEPDEEITTVKVLEIGPPDSRVLYVVVGTTMAPPEGAIESTRGRILLLQGSDAESMQIIHGLEVPGCVYGIAALDGRLAAVINHSLIVYNFDDPMEGGLTQKARWNRGYILTSIVITKDNNIAVADALRSITLLKLDGEKLECIAQNYQRFWSFSIEAAGEESVICGELDHNISLFKREGENLERIGGFHYGELVNKFILGSMHEDTPDAPVRPTMLIVTPTGRISVVANLDDATSLLLTRLQQNMETVIQGPANLTLSSWRTPQTRGTPATFAGFIDGDFVQEVLDMSPAQAQKVISGRNEFESLTSKKDEVWSTVEMLSTSH